MMIDVKGTDKAVKPAAVSYEHYALKTEDGRSSTPLYFGVFLTGLALYLKSVFPSWGEEAPVNEPERQPDDQGRGDAPDRVKGQIAAFSILTDESAEPAEAPKENNVIPFQQVGLPEAASLEFFESPLVEMPMFDFSRLDLRKFGEMSFTVQPANDNGGAASSLSAGQGGSAEPAAGSVQDKDDKRPNKAPRASGPVRLADVYSINAALFGLSDLLRNASDSDGDALRVGDITVSSGALTQIAGGWVYDPATLGQVTITYHISDGHSVISQTATFSVLQGPPIVGTDKADVLFGGNLHDELEGGAGADKIIARGGDDVIAGGDGNDQLAGGDGDDIIHAGSGDDIVLAGAGDDQLWGGDGKDQLSGEAGHDTIFGEAGDDRIYGGGDDDALFGDDGADIVYGDAGNDTIQGGIGNDILIGGAGKDIIAGGADNDVIIGDADRSDDDYDGGAGNDAIDYSAVTSAVDVDTGTGRASGTRIGRDKITGFEIARAGSGNDTIAGSERNELFEGNAGNDSIAGKGGNDNLFGDDGDDNLQGGAGSDALHGNAGNDCLSGDEGSDTVYGDAGDDTVRGDRDGANDTYDGGAGVDTLDYSAALMTVAINLAIGKAVGDEIGQDSFTGFEIIKGGAGQDTLMGSAGNDVIYDGGGRDRVTGALGNDRVVAAADGADDIYDAGAGTDTIDYSQTASGVLINLRTGQATGVEIGTDQIGNFEVAVGGSGNDSFVMGSNAAVLSGGGGSDNFEFYLPETGAADLIHQILDFMVGDRVNVSKYQMFEKVMDNLGDQFQQVYGEQNASQALPIRVLHERTDALEQTLIQIDMDGDNHYEMTINLSGNHMLMIVETA